MAPPNPLYLIENYFSPDECEQLTPRDLHPVNDSRRSYWTTRTEIVTPDVDPRWWVKRMSDAMVEANNAKYGFDLGGKIQIQRLEYRWGSCFDWHADLNMNPAIQRKLTAIAFLSDKSSYRGGRTEWIGAPSMTQDQGTVVVFPSWIPHRVRLVTEGLRHILAAWARGPAFR